MNEGVPRGWSQTRIGEVVDVFNGKAGGTGGTWLRVFKTRHVYDGYVRLSNPVFAPDDRASSISKVTYLRGGDTLTPNMAHGTIGRVAFVREAAENWTVDGQIMVLRPKGDPVIGRYVYDWMSRPESKGLLVNMEKGGAFDELRGQTHIYRGDVASINILLPPVSEQRKIAAILSSVDDAIEAMQAVIDQLEVVKTAMLAELLTRGLPGRHSRFKQTAIGDLPEEWEVTTLSAVCLTGGLQTGPFGSQLKASEYTPEGVPVIMPKDIVGQRVTTESIARIPEARAKSLPRHRVKVGDILFGRRGDIGRCALVREPERGWICGTGCLRARPDSVMNPEFLVRWLGFARVVAWLNEHAVGQTMLNLSTEILGKTPIAIPSSHEQAELACLFSAVERRIDSTREHLSATLSLKSALRSVLLTGELRVTPDPEPV